MRMGAVSAFMIGVSTIPEHGEVRRSRYSPAIHAKSACPDSQLPAAMWPAMLIEHHRLTCVFIQSLIAILIVNMIRATFLLAERPSYYQLSFCSGSFVSASSHLVFESLSDRHMFLRWWQRAKLGYFPYSSKRTEPDSAVNSLLSCLRTFL